MPAAVSHHLRRPWAPLLVFAGGVVILRLPSFGGRLFDPDEAALSAQGIGLWRGGEMYADAIDRKPPFAPFLYQWSHRLTGDTDLRLLHLLAGALLLAAVFVVAGEAGRVAGRRAMWWAGGLMLTGALALMPVDAQAANYSHFALPFGAFAMVAARRGTDRAAVIAGFSLAVATLTRQTWAIAVIPATVAILRFGVWRRHLPLALLGGLLPIGVMAAVVSWDDFLYWTFRSNGSFVLGGAQWGTILGRGVYAGAVFAVLHLVAVRFSIAGWHASIRRDPDLWLWVGTGLVAITAGYRFYGHYWLQIVPPLALLAADELRNRPRPTQLRAGRVIAVTAMVTLVLAWLPGVVRDLPNPDPLADVVTEHSGENDTVLVWGNFPEIYWAAERAPAGGFVSMDFVTGRSGARENGPATIPDAPERGYPHLLAAIEERPPALVIDTQPRGFREYGPYPIALFPELQDFIDERYEPPVLVDGFDVYILRAPTG